MEKEFVPYELALRLKAIGFVIKPIDDKKLELGYNLTKNGLIMGAYTTYEKAEQACLDKLIKIVETELNKSE